MNEREPVSKEQMEHMLRYLAMEIHEADIQIGKFSKRINELKMNKKDLEKMFDSMSAWGKFMWGYENEETTNEDI